MGGYEPPAISQLYLGATTFGTDANGEYDSLRRPGIEARGQIIQVKGRISAKHQDWSFVPLLETHVLVVGSFVVKAYGKAVTRCLLARFIEMLM